MTTAWDDLAAENAWLRKEMEAMSQDILKVQCELAEFQIEYGTPAAMKEYVSGLEQALAERTTALEERTRELDALRALDRETARAYNLNLLESAEDRAAIREHKQFHDSTVAGGICQCAWCMKHAPAIARASQGTG